MRVLVVEDETKVGSFIKRALEEESYAVDLCEDGAQGLDLALSGSYDVIVIDLMLPNLPGLEILRRIRKEKIHTPVLILTAQSKVDQKVKGLDAGADDYLTKPFAIDELLARVRVLLRRGTAELLLYGTSPGRTLMRISPEVLSEARELAREVGWTEGEQRASSAARDAR